MRWRLRWRRRQRPQRYRRCRHQLWNVNCEHGFGCAFPFFVSVRTLTAADAMIRWLRNLEMHCTSEPFIKQTHIFEWKNDGSRSANFVDWHCIKFFRLNKVQFLKLSVKEFMKKVTKHKPKSLTKFLNEFVIECLNTRSKYFWDFYFWNGANLKCIHELVSMLRLFEFYILNSSQSLLHVQKFCQFLKM